MENSTADLEYASKVASMLMQSFPNQPHDPKTFLRQLAMALTGESKSTLRLMADPREGWIAKERFPTLASANEWLDARRSPKTFLAPREAPEHRLLPPPKDDTPEEGAEVKEAAISRWKDKRKKLISDFGGEGKPSLLTWHQAHDPDALITALGNHGKEKAA